MKFDLNKIMGVASRARDLVSQGQQIISTGQNVYEVLNKNVKNKDKNQIIESISDSEECPEEVTEIKNSQSEYQCKDKIMTVVGSISTPLGAVTTLNEIVDKANETIRFCEEQKTLRTEIKANASVEISKINAMADLMRDYLQRSFDERASLFDNYFSILGKALNKGDNVLVAQTLQSINSLAASSPFKDLADINKVSTMLAEGGEWDI